MEARLLCLALAAFCTLLVAFDTLAELLLGLKLQFVEAGFPKLSTPCLAVYNRIHDKSKLRLLYKKERESRRTLNSFKYLEVMGLD